MTEDHDQTGRAFAQEPEWDRPDDGGEAVRRSEAFIEAAQPISQSLLRHTKAVDRSVKELDDVVAELRRIADARPTETPTSLRNGTLAKVTEEARPVTAPLPGDNRAQPREVQPPSPQGKAPLAPPRGTPTAPAADSVRKPDPIRLLTPRMSEPAQRAVSPMALRNGTPAKVTEEARPFTAPLPGDNHAQPREVQPPSPQGKAPLAPPRGTPTAPAADSVRKPDPSQPQTALVSPTQSGH